MKKYLLIIPLLALLLIPNFHVNALSYTKGTEEIEVTEDNYIYYFYSKYPQYFEDYNYFISDFINVTRFNIYFFNSTNLKYESGFIILCEDDIGTVQSAKYYNRDFTQTAYSNSINPSNIKFSNFDISISGFSFSANISKQDLIDYFNTSVEPTPSPTIEPTPSPTIEPTPSPTSEPIIDNFDSNIHNLSVSILGDDIPEEFDFIYIIFDFLIVLLIIVCVISPFILLFKIMGVL